MDNPTPAAAAVERAARTREAVIQARCSGQWQDWSKAAQWASGLERLCVEAMRAAQKQEVKRAKSGAGLADTGSQGGRGDAAEPDRELRRGYRGEARNGGDERTGPALPGDGAE